jgi:hypothetical protein
LAFRHDQQLLSIGSDKLPKALHIGICDDKLTKTIESHPQVIECVVVQLVDDFSGFVGSMLQSYHASMSPGHEVANNGVVGIGTHHHAPKVLHLASERDNLIGLNKAHDIAKAAAWLRPLAFQSCDICLKLGKFPLCVAELRFEHAVLLLELSDVVVSIHK